MSTENKFLVDVLRTRNEGMRIARFQLYNHVPKRGYLLVKDEFRADLHRHARVATLVDAKNTAVKDLPPLWDTTLLYAANGMFSLGGFECIDKYGLGEFSAMRDYAQTWLIYPAGALDDMYRRADGTLRAA